MTIMNKKNTRAYATKSSTCKDPVIEKLAKEASLFSTESKFQRKLFTFLLVVPVQKEPVHAG